MGSRVNFLKTLFWIVLSAVVVVFSLNNWVPVEVQLWGGLEADIKLPVLMLFFFLVGLVPALIYYRTKNWRLNRRLGTVERQLTDARGLKQFRAPERQDQNTAGELSLDSTAEAPIETPVGTAAENPPAAPEAKT